MKVYPRFTFYPEPVPFDAVLLQSGVILQYRPNDMNHWQSSLFKIDQTYTAPRYYIQTGQGCYEIAERVNETHDLETFLSGEHTLPPSTPSKPSVLRQLQETAQEVGHCPPPKGKAKGGEAR